MSDGMTGRDIDRMNRASRIMGIIRDKHLHEFHFENKRYAVLSEIASLIWITDDESHDEWIAKCLGNMFKQIDLDTYWEWGLGRGGPEDVKRDE